MDPPVTVLSLPAAKMLYSQGWEGRLNEGALYRVEFGEAGENQWGSRRDFPFFRAFGKSFRKERVAIAIAPTCSRSKSERRPSTKLAGSPVVDSASKEPRWASWPQA
jgi:hypothetical protein